jgi:hypothetical protein
LTNKSQQNRGEYLMKKVIVDFLMHAPQFTDGESAELYDSGVLYPVGVEKVVKVKDLLTRDYIAVYHGGKPRQIATLTTLGLKGNEITTNSDFEMFNCIEVTPDKIIGALKAMWLLNNDGEEVMHCCSRADTAALLYILGKDVDKALMISAGTFQSFSYSLYLGGKFDPTFKMNPVETWKKMTKSPPGNFALISSLESFRASLLLLNKFPGNPAQYQEQVGIMSVSFDGEIIELLENPLRS